MALAAAVEAPYANNTLLRVFDITGLDADTTGTFNHGMTGVIAATTWIEVQEVASVAANWACVLVGTTQFTVTKANVAGSATGLVPAARIMIWIFHSMIQ